MAKRNKTNYPGIIYYEVPSRIRKGKMEKVYYIYARVNGKLVEEKVGRQWEEGITAAKANDYLVDRRTGKRKSAKEIREEEAAAKKAEAGRWTISKLWESYKELNPIKGIESDQNRFKNYVQPTFGNKEPKEIIKLDVDRFRISLLKKRSPATVHHVLELLRRICNFGVNNQLCDPLPAKIKMPTVNNEVDFEQLTGEQLTILLKAIEDSPHVIAGAMMKMVLYSGMRRGELYRLQWDHIDEVNGLIKIVGPKGGKDQTIPLSDSARDLLDSLPRDSKFIFPDKDGNQRKYSSKGVAAIKREAGLPKEFRMLHGLRHTFASLLASSGKVDLYTIQRLLTHKSPIMTQRYAHLMPGPIKEASNLAGDIVNASVKPKRTRTKKSKKVA